MYRVIGRRILYWVLAHEYWLQNNGVTCYCMNINMLQTILCIYKGNISPIFFWNSECLEKLEVMFLCYLKCIGHSSMDIVTEKKENIILFRGLQWFDVFALTLYMRPFVMIPIIMHSLFINTLTFSSTKKIFLKDFHRCKKTFK